VILKVHFVNRHWKLCLMVEWAKRMSEVQNLKVKKTVWCAKENTTRNRKSNRKECWEKKMKIEWRSY